MLRLVFQAIVSLTAGAILSEALAQAQFPAAPAPQPKEPANPNRAANEARVEREGRAREAVVRVQADSRKLADEYAHRMQPFFFLELRFAAAVCELSREQRQAIANRAKPMIDDLARELAEHDQQEEGRNPNMVDVHLNPARRLLDGLGPIVKAQVSSEKWSRYRDELKKRDADRKQAIIHNLVASLDRELIMSASQRQKLRDVFIDEWKDDWGWGSAVEMDTDVWLPDISEERVAPILSDAQHKAWKQLEKKAPDPWEGFEFAAELFEITRTADEAEIGKVAGFPADSQ